MSAVLTKYFIIVNTQTRERWTIEGFYTREQAQRHINNYYPDERHAQILEVMAMREVPRRDG